MGLYDRDWVQEEYKKKEEKYGWNKSSGKNNNNNTPMAHAKIHIDTSNSKPDTCSQCHAKVDVNKDMLFTPFTLAYKFKCPRCGIVNTRYTIGALVYVLGFMIFVLYMVLRIVGVI